MLCCCFYVCYNNKAKNYLKLNFVFSFIFFITVGISKPKSTELERNFDSTSSYHHCTCIDCYICGKWLEMVSYYIIFIIYLLKNVCRTFVVFKYSNSNTYILNLLFNHHDNNSAYKRKYFEVIQIFALNLLIRFQYITLGRKKK